MWLCLIIHAAINQDFYFWRFLELPYYSVVFLSIMTSTSQELYQRANIAFLHLSLSRTIIIFANIIDICHPSQHFQMHFEKIICEASKSRVIFYFFVFILSMDHIDYGYFYNHMLL